MAWQDRIKEAALTTPSGLRFTFEYTDVSKEVEALGTVWEFPDFTGSYVQDTGRSGRRINQRFFISGDNYDIDAANFDQGLNERGNFTLEHPVYGRLLVGIVGAIARRDDLVTGANQAVYEVPFIETTDLLYPLPQTDPASVVLTAADEYTDAAATHYSERTNLVGAVEQASARNRYELVLAQTRTALFDALRQQLQVVQNTASAIFDSINTAIDILIGEPLTLAYQTILFINSLSQGVQGIKDRLNSYLEVALSIAGVGFEPYQAGLDSRPANDFYTDELYAMAAIVGGVRSVVNAQFETKGQALDAAEQLLETSEQVTVWRDTNYESLGEIDTGEAYQQYQEAVAVAVGYLVEISYSLKQERAIVLDGPTTILNLEAELYGTIDENLDRLIADNQLNGSEIATGLAKGRQVVYYV